MSRRSTVAGGEVLVVWGAPRGVNWVGRGYSVFSGGVLRCHLGQRHYYRYYNSSMVGCMQEAGSVLGSVLPYWTAASDQGVQIRYSRWQECGWMRGERLSRHGARQRKLGAIYATPAPTRLLPLAAAWRAYNKHIQAQY